MLAALPIWSSFGLDPIIPHFSSLFSATLVTSALKFPRGLTTQLHTREHQPNHFPLFPHPVNIAHAGTPANPSSSIVYFTTSGYPRDGGICPSRPHSTPRAKVLAARLSPLGATLTKYRGAPTTPHSGALPATHYSPPTTHSPTQSATLSLWGNHERN